MARSMNVALAKTLVEMGGDRKKESPPEFDGIKPGSDIEPSEGESGSEF